LDGIGASAKKQAHLIGAVACRRFGSLYFNGKCFKVKGEPSE
jgi:hypothetical protein